MKQAILFLLAFSFVLETSAQQRPIPPTRAKVPQKTAPTNKQAVEEEKEPVVIMKMAPTVNMTNFLFMKSVKSGRVTDEGGERELKVQGKGYRSYDNSTVTPVKTETKNNKICAQERINTDFSTDDFAGFTQNGPPDWLKPGVILKASSFVQGTEVIEEKYDRSPITISTTARGPIQSSVKIPNPRTRSQINEAVRQLVSQDKSRAGANMNFRYHEIHSQDELNFKITGRFSSSIGKIAADLGVKNETRKEYHHYLVEFQQTLFSLEVDGLDKEKVFKNNPEVSTEDYVYLSKVNYGRRGYFVFTSRKSIDELNANSSASGSAFGVSGTIKASLQTLQNSSEVEVRAFYYGGTLQSAANSVVRDIKNTGIPLEEYILASNFSPAEAYPISYELKNLNNERVGMSTKSVRTVETCKDAIANLKLKVTLSEIVCETTSDRDKIADYTIIQNILYKAKGKNKVVKDKRYNKHGGDCNAGGPNAPLPGSVSMICGSDSKQIHVSENKKKTHTVSSNNINNYVIFEVTPEEANDPNAEFFIKTYVKENNGGSNDIRLNHDNENIEVAIKDVIAILSGVKTLRDNGSYPYDNAVDPKLKFDYFGGTKMPLTKVAGDKIVLEGAIRARNKGQSLTDKAFLWIRFELVD